MRRLAVSQLRLHEQLFMTSSFNPPCCLLAAPLFSAFSSGLHGAVSFGQWRAVRCHALQRRSCRSATSRCATCATSAHPRTVLLFVGGAALPSAVQSWLSNLGAHAAHPQRRHKPASPLVAHARRPIALRLLLRTCKVRATQRCLLLDAQRQRLHGSHGAELREVCTPLLHTRVRLCLTTKGGCRRQTKSWFCASFLSSCAPQPRALHHALARAVRAINQSFAQPPLADARAATARHCPRTAARPCPRPTAPNPALHPAPHRVRARLRARRAICALPPTPARAPLPPNIRAPPPSPRRSHHPPISPLVRRP